MTKEEVLSASIDQCRARLAEIVQMAQRGDFSYDYDEVIWLEERIPEERRANQRMMKAREKLIDRLSD